MALLIPLLLAGCGGKKATAPTPTPTAAPGAPPSGDTLQQLQQQVTAGKLDQAVLNDLQAKGAADGIIVLNEELVMTRVKQAAAVIGVTVNDDQLVDLRTKEYEALKQQLLEAYPGSAAILENFKSFGSVFVHFSNSSTLLAVLKRPEITAVTADEQYKKQQSAGQPNPRPPLSVSLGLINQPAAVSAGFTGQGVAVAVLDTGVDYKRDAFGPCTAPGAPAGKCRVADFTHIGPDDGKIDSDPESMHGTNVSGIVAGVAPNARIIALDIFDGDHTGAALELKGLDWVMQHRAQYNIVSVNLSVGASKDYHTTACTESPLTGAFDQLRRAGVVPVVAAGNDASAGGSFTNGIEKPACAPGAVSVGAVYLADIGKTDFGDCGDSQTKADVIACFSQSGPNLGLLAPGARITAAGITESGTSQATPHVAAAVAALASKCKGANADQLTQALINSGPELTDRRNGLKKHRLDIVAAGQALTGAGACRADGARPNVPGTPGVSTPAPTQTVNPGQQDLYSRLLTTRFAASELPTGFSAPQPGPGTPSDSERKFKATSAVDVAVRGPDDIDLLYYTFFPSDADAKAYFQDQNGSSSTKPSGFDSPAGCNTGSASPPSGQKIGITRCVVQLGSVIVTAVSGVRGDAPTHGNDRAAIALAKSGVAHLKTVQKGK